MPCNYVHPNIEDSVAEECIADREKQIAYLGNINLVVYASEQVFDQEMFGEDAIVTRSRFWSRQVDSAKPTWLDG